VTYFATGPQVGGGSVPIVPFRRDHSVGGAWVDGFQNAAGPTGPIFRTQTNLNPAGGYTGSGTGNKAILGKFLAAPMPLGALVSMEWTVTSLQPEAPAGPGIHLPYCNLIVDLGGPPVVPPFVAQPPPPLGLVVLVFGDELAAPARALGTFTTPGPDQRRCVWTAAADRALTVIGKGMAVFPDPPGPTIVPSPDGPQPTANTPLGIWQNFSRTLGAILAAYPGAMIVNANPVDGGLPLATTDAGFLLIVGDSSNRIQSATRLDSWKINGAEV